MRWSRSLLVLVALVALVATACRPIRPTGKASLDEGMPECPHLWGPKDDSVYFAVPGRNTNVPEFHDCQRLRLPGAAGADAEYGPMAAVFSPDSTRAVNDSALRSGAVAAYVYMRNPSDEYPALKIASQHNCVFVEQQVGFAVKAWMIPAANDAECVQPEIRNRRRDEHLLLVNPIGPFDNATRNPIPNVARWDWDESTKTHYIGVRCGQRWCEIGRLEGFQSSGSYLDGVDSPSADDLMFAHKGAYDEQYLAEFPGDELETANNVGTIVPTPELADFTTRGAEDGKWTRVARIFLRPAAGTYEKSFNFVASNRRPPAAPSATLSICHQTDDVSCAAPTRRYFRTDACTPDEEGRVWLARVDREGNAPKFFCVRYREHKDAFTIPPVVRWRWRENDETIWVSCRAGCCEVNAI